MCVVEVAMHGVGGGWGAPWAERACAWGGGRVERAPLHGRENWPMAGIWW